MSAFTPTDDLIQSAMLPGQPLQTLDVVVSHEFQPMAEVGGDYLDYFALPDGKVGLYVADASGKGLPAALYAALAVGTLRGIHKTGLSPNRRVSLLNARAWRYSAVLHGWTNEGR